MTVTDITEISKTKVKVCVDCGAAFALYKSELKPLRINADKELPEESYRCIMDEILPKRARQRCMNLLKYRDYTECQLKMKLRQGLYPDRAIEDAVAYAVSYGYVDDARYAENYIRRMSFAKSRRQIKNILSGKDISRENIERAYTEYERENNPGGEEAVIERLLAGKHFDSRSADSKECRRIIGFLYRRGFPMDKIVKAVAYNA